MAIPRTFASLSLALALVLLLVVTPLCTANIILYSGETLRAGRSLVWERYTFSMQTDCNAVLYDLRQPIWASQTHGMGQSCYLTLQRDGNLVIYDGTNAPVWATNTNTQEEATSVLVMQKDRNVVLYRPATWATNTNIGVSGSIFIESKATIFGALPANKTTGETKAAGIAMVVDN